MIQLSTFLVIMMGLFAIVGFLRGWTKELIAMSGLVLALFAIAQLEALLIDPLTQGQQGSKFYLQAFILLVIAFFAYQTPPETLARGEVSSSNREGFQDGILGAIVGAFNGYLLVGSLWWYMDNLQYPLAPLIDPAAPGTASQSFVDWLPLAWMLSGDGGLLSILMIALFLFVIVAVV